MLLTNRGVTAAATTFPSSKVASKITPPTACHVRHQSDKSDFSLERVVRPNIWRLQQYHFPPRYDFSNAVLLDANENPLGPSLLQDGEGQKHSAYLKQLHLERYPDPRASELKQAFAELRGVRKSSVILGVGSDELIDLLIRICCAPSSSEAIMICSPTYAMYSCFAEINDVRVVDVPLHDAAGGFQLHTERIINQLDTRKGEIKLVFLCSPGNPTGRLLSLHDIEAVLTAAACANSMVVVDEAYIDFASVQHDRPVSAMSLLSTFPNLIVMQTLSKAWALAGVRLGVGFTSDMFADIFNKVKAPFNVSTLAQDVALRALAGADNAQANVQHILGERQRIRAAILQDHGGSAGVEVHDSDANFLLVRVPGIAADVCSAMAAECNVCVRFRGNMLHCQDCIRVSIGTAEENDAFLIALRHVMATKVLTTVIGSVNLSKKMS